MPTVHRPHLVVSGGSRGIGLAIALGAAKHGANVVLLAKTAEPHPKLPGTVHTAVAEVEAAGGKGVAVVGDVRKEEDVQRAVDAAVEHFGGVDIVRQQRQRHRDRADRGAVGQEVRPDDGHQRPRHVPADQGRACRTCASRRTPHVLTLAPPLNMNPHWLGAHPSYTLSKYGMTLLSLGWAAEYADGGHRVQPACGRRPISRRRRWPTWPTATMLAARRAARRSWPTPRSRSCPGPPADVNGKCFIDADGAGRSRRHRPVPLRRRRRSHP